jgi:hypothetical protein
MRPETEFNTRVQRPELIQQCDITVHRRQTLFGIKGFFGCVMKESRRGPKSLMQSECELARRHELRAPDRPSEVVIAS